MKSSVADVLVAIPVLPLFPVIMTWWLPWETWIPKRIPKFVLGPYCLYAAFAAWYFNFGFWTVSFAVVLGLGLSIVAIVEKLSN